MVLDSVLGDKECPGDTRRREATHDELHQSFFAGAQAVGGHAERQQLFGLRGFYYDHRLRTPVRGRLGQRTVVLYENGPFAGCIRTPHTPACRHAESEGSEGSRMSPEELDQNKAEEFAERMLGVLNEGALALMTSVGHRTGLFDAMAGLVPSTSEQIASAASLNERYVREWLAAMVVGGIVEHDPEHGTYRLPPEHAAFLTRAATPDNIAVTAQFIPVLACVEDRIVESFKNGGGVPYSAYTRFHEVMAKDSGQTVVAALTDYILPLVPGLTGLLEAGIDVLDVGCGCGRALDLMARKFPESSFVGYDFSEEAIARAAAQEHGTTNVRFEVKDVAALDEEDSYDLI